MQLARRLTCPLYCTLRILRDPHLHTLLHPPTTQVVRNACVSWELLEAPRDIAGAIIAQMVPLRTLQVIEKAYKKLRLDAMVIQQGRLTENTKSVNKDDLLAMVRYGAEMVFSGDKVRCTRNPEWAHRPTRCSGALPV